MIEKRHISYVILFVVFLALQLAFWRETTHQRPDMSILPTPLSTEALKAMSFGDEEYVFRIISFLVSNAGDTFGRTTRLIDYDIKPVIAWFKLMDSLNDRSIIAPYMAAYYFGQSQNIKHIRPIVDYLVENSARDLEKKWWWRIQAAYLSTHRLSDTHGSLAITLPLAKLTTAPYWVQQYPAFVYEKMGEMEEAQKIIEAIILSKKDIPKDELGFMQAFIENRIKRLEQLNPDVKKRFDSTLKEKPSK